LVQEQAFYPFGLQMAAISSKAILKTTDPYKYNAGSELEEELNYYNTFYRKHDAQIGRFTGVDIRSEESAGMSVYNFGANNPVMFNDPLGDKFKMNAFDKDPARNDRTTMDVQIATRQFENSWENLLDGLEGLSFGGGPSAYGYRSADAAAIAWSFLYGELSIQNKVEVSSLIYKDGKGKYFYTPALNWNKDAPGVDDPSHSSPGPIYLRYKFRDLLKDKTEVAHIHSHGGFSKGADEFFSTWDTGWPTDRNYDIQNAPITERGLGMAMRKENRHLDFYLLTPA